jgi:hypothetical protein
VAARQSVTVAEHEARLARLATKPDWNMELMYGARSGGRDGMITLLFGMDLPIATAQRQRRVWQRTGRWPSARSGRSRPRTATAFRVAQRMGGWQSV